MKRFLNLRRLQRTAAERLGTSDNTSTTVNFMPTDSSAIFNDIEETKRET
jgi:hypothetical protein